MSTVQVIDVSTGVVTTRPQTPEERAQAQVDAVGTETQRQALLSEAADADELRGLRADIRPQLGDRAALIAFLGAASPSNAVTVAALKALIRVVFFALRRLG